MFSWSEKIRIAAAALLGLSAVNLCAEERQEGTVHVPAFELPLSELLSAESQAVLERQQNEQREFAKRCLADARSIESANTRPLCGADYVDQVHQKLIARHKARYAVNIEPQTIAGVPAEVITPAAGVSPEHRDRVLIALHGGAFRAGGRWAGQVESIPIAAVGKFRVISVDYRLAPQYRFPAATEDVAAVYQELLKSYKPENIGIYGCSAGGLLTAQTVAWLQWKKLPRPGAVGMFCAAGAYYGEGDSGPIASALTGIPVDLLKTTSADPYLKDTATNDPLVFPIRSEQVLAKFPPSLLISSTRDQALSSVAKMHSRLVALGVEAQLHVWEGLGHGFFAEPELTESREAYSVIARFFDLHLGQP